MKSYKKNRRSKRKTFSAKVEKEIRKVEECKFLTPDALLNATTAANLITDLSAVPQGISRSQRIGDRLRLKNLGFSGFFYDANVALKYNYLRVVLFQWYPKTTPVVTDVLLTAATSAPLRMDNVSMYRVYMDKIFSIATTTSNNYHHFSGTIKPLPSQTQVLYDSASTTGTNKFYCLYQYNTTGVAAVGEVYTRFILRYYDS